MVLASTSPRRRRMLGEAGVAHEAVSPGLDDAELGVGCGTARQWVCALAYLKAVAGFEVVARAGEDVRGMVVLGADTVVIKGEQLYGKARDEEEARRMIGEMEEAWHEVVTGVAVVEPLVQKRTVWFDAARVWVGRIGREAVAEYAAGGGWRGKAGAYNLEERVGAGWPIRWEGDPTTVMGLPMTRLMAQLRAMGLAGGEGAA